MMKNRKRPLLLSLLLLLLVSAYFYINQYLLVNYDVNIVEYFQMSSELTQEEEETLRRYPHLIYGGNISEPPMGIYYPELHQHVGLVQDYLNALSIEISKSIITEPMVWSEALLALERGETDLCDMIPSPERGEHFVFSKPLYDLKGIAVVPASSQIGKLSELSGTAVGVQRGDITIEELTRQGISPAYVYADDSLQALQLLREGKVEAVVGDEPVIWYHINEMKNREEYRILPGFIYQKSCSIAVSKENAGLLPIIDKGILQLRKKGIFDQIEKKWLGSNLQLFNNRAQARSQLDVILIFLLVFWGAFLAYLFNRSLMALVSHKTRELSAMRDELQIAFDGMAPFLIVLSQKGKILNVNKAFAAYSQNPKSDLIGLEYGRSSLLQAIGQVFVREFGKEMHELDHDGKFEFEYAARYYVVEFYPLPRDHADNRSLLLIISDITQSREKTDKLSHAQKMAAIGSLVAGVAHELRNPLGIIRNAAFALDQEEEDAPKEIERYAVHVINDAVDNANRTIDSLLNYSRMTYGEMAEVDLSAMMKEISYLQTDFRKKGITLTCTCHVLRKIRSYPNSIRHILMNLVQNAADSMPSGGNVEVLAFLEQEKNLQRLMLSVSDEGPGIPPEVLPRIFEPFFTTKAAGKGTGLGLYIVYSELQKLRGEIKVLPGAGGGTRFEVSLPLAEDPQTTLAGREMS